jgi:cell wall-associated NlpC family hydrolase
MRVRAVNFNPSPDKKCGRVLPLRLFPAIFLLLATFSRGVALADGTLTLQLPPSQAAVEARREALEQARKEALEQAQAAAAANAAIRNRAPLSSRGRMTPRGQSENARTVGRLGQLMSNTGIFRQRSFSSALLTHAATGTYLAIQQEVDGWDGVLMADGSTGWLPTRAVQKLDYEVEATGAYHAVAATGSLPGYSEADDIYPRTSQPYFTGDAQALLKEAYKYLGVPYVWGGNTFHGLDCSGFIKNVFGACGYNLPRLGSDQMAYGVPVPVDQLQAGDRLYFGKRTDRVGVTHTGLYIGNGYFIHSSSSRHGVAISHLSEPLFRRIYVCARR